MNYDQKVNTRVLLMQGLRYSLNRDNGLAVRDYIDAAKMALYDLLEYDDNVYFQNTIDIMLREIKNAIEWDKKEDEQLWLKFVGYLETFRG